MIKSFEWLKNINRLNKIKVLNINLSNTHKYSVYSECKNYYEEEYYFHGNTIKSF